MKRQTIIANHIQTICWFENTLVDWESAGTQYALDGQVKQLNKYHFGFNCDGAICSEDGQYSFIYQRLGTKGLLIKNGKILREINRSYYHADTYEYPAALVTLNNKTYLIHCPLKYSHLDFEEVETGEIVTAIQSRNPEDFFHSRLEISPDKNYLLSKGWRWHPWDSIRVFKIDECFKNPELLDEMGLYPDVGTEICTASFLDDSSIVIGSSNEEERNDEILMNLPQECIAVWNVQKDEISTPVKVQAKFGNLFVINEEFAWDLYEFPKIINYKTGEVVDKDETIASGKQNSSIIHHLGKLPKIAFNRETKQIAIATRDSIEVLSPN